MSELEVEIVIDKWVLDELPTNNKYLAFLKHWVTINKTKAVVLLKHWKAFCNEWERSLKESSDEIRQPFFAAMRGIVTPYRKKYGIEAGLDCDDDNDEIEEDETAIMGVVSRHYATVKYLVVKNPENYRGCQTKINSDRIVTPEDFFHLIETTKYEVVQEFLTEYES